MSEEEKTCHICGCQHSKKPVAYKCDCGEGCECNIIEFDTLPEAIPYCCCIPMKRIT